MRPVTVLCVVLVLAAVDAKRGGFGGLFGKRGGSSSRYNPPKQQKPQHTPQHTPYNPPSHTQTHNNDPFLNAERGGTHSRPNPFNPSAPQPPPSSHNTNGPIGFEKVGGSHGQGNQNIGFENLNNQAQNRPGSHVPSAPHYPPANGPPPAYPGSHTGGAYGGAHDHPPAYPGRPINAPPMYQANNPHYPNTGGFGSNPGQFQGNGQFQSQGHFNSNPGQPSYGSPGFGGGFGNTGYPQNNQFGTSHPGSYSGYGGSPMGNSPFGYSYPQSSPFGGNSFGGGNSGHYGYPNYSPNNFGYSSYPGYGGHQYEKKSRFGGLPIPIPIPIPIPMGGFGGFGGHSYNHRVLDSFIKNKNTTDSSNSSSSVFILNNSTVTPCTTDHFVYDRMRVTVESCTADHCTAIKVTTRTNTTTPVVHGAGLTVCLEGNVTFSFHGDKVVPEVSPMQRNVTQVCAPVPSNVTTVANSTEVTTAVPADTTTDSTTTAVPAETTTVSNTTQIPSSNSTTNITEVCEPAECFSVEMCLPSIEVVDACKMLDCPFKRTGYKPCVTLKMCRSPSTPVSTFASINTTISKIDEYNHKNSVYDFANLTLISYHRPVINFNCTQNSSAPGCQAPVAPTAQLST